MSDLCSSELTQGSCVPRYTAFGRTRHERAGRAAHVQSSLRTQQRRHVQPSLRAQRSNPVAPPDQATHTYRPFIPSRSEEHTSELQSLMRIQYAVFCLKKKKKK